MAPSVQCPACGSQFVVPTEHFEDLWLICPRCEARVANPLVLLSVKPAASGTPGRQVTAALRTAVGTCLVLGGILGSLCCPVGLWFEDVMRRDYDGPGATTIAATVGFPLLLLSGLLLLWRKRDEDRFLVLFDAWTGVLLVLLLLAGVGLVIFALNRCFPH
jgi:hypothetical protein